MSYLERAITDGRAKFSGDANNDIQPVSQEALIGAIKKCHQTLWAGGKLSPPTAFGELCIDKFGGVDQFCNAVNQLQSLLFAA